MRQLQPCHRALERPEPPISCSSLRNPLLFPLTQSIESDMLVCTVGEVRVWPGASNVIAGNTQLSIDIRSKDDALRSEVVSNVTASIEALCAARHATCSVMRVHDAQAVPCDSGIVQVGQAPGGLFISVCSTLIFKGILIPLLSL